jgi:hypothetical protein
MLEKTIAGERESDAYFHTPFQFSDENIFLNFQRTFDRLLWWKVEFQPVEKNIILDLLCTLSFFFQKIT